MARKNKRLPREKLPPLTGARPRTPGVAELAPGATKVTNQASRAKDSPRVVRSGNDSRTKVAYEGPNRGG
jgi:hypothetical protein